ncbi:MAG: hypothetical protein JWM75_2357 [Sphingomonas bacterium]|nr:hypothetical protein [Sphingomonas bacterium]
MHPLHLTKVAVGCVSVDELAGRLDGRATGAETTVTTRYKPKRADELIGGSLFWIIKHRLVARQTILGFGECDDGRRCVIQLSAALVPVRAYPKRAHQGWRYLQGGDAPGDLADGAGDLGQMPPSLISELAALALL